MTEQELTTLLAVDPQKVLEMMLSASPAEPKPAATIDDHLASINFYQREIDNSKSPVYRRNQARYRDSICSKVEREYGVSPVMNGKTRAWECFKH
jgi:hypothetical protein